MQTTFDRRYVNNCSINEKIDVFLFMIDQIKAQVNVTDDEFNKQLNLIKSLLTKITNIDLTVVQVYDDIIAEIKSVIHYSDNFLTSNLYVRHVYYMTLWMLHLMLNYFCSSTLYTIEICINSIFYWFNDITHLDEAVFFEKFMSEKLFNIMEG